MSKLAKDFSSLPSEYLNVLRLAQEQHNIEIQPLQELAGGWSGAFIYLVSVSPYSSDKVEHCILKLDHQRKKMKADETERHNMVRAQASPEFARDHLAAMAFDRVELEGAIAIFYTIAGHSLHQYRPVSSFDRQNQLETIFRATNKYLLEEWNAKITFERAIHPQKILEWWLGYRLKPGGNIERFLEDVCQVQPGVMGFLIQGSVFPNPLVYARQAKGWGPIRAVDGMIGFQHGDLNINNILVRFSGSGNELDGYYLIDFALFKEKMPLLYDQRYLEMSYLILNLSQASLAKVVDLITHFAEVDLLDPRQAPVELAGACSVIDSARSAFDSWVKDSYPSLYDDLWGQYWLAGVAAGLSYCHKPGLPNEGRLISLIYAAANLKRYASLFGVSLPVEAARLPVTSQPGEQMRQLSLQLFETPTMTSDAPRHNLPSQITPFVGREVEIVALSELLLESNLHLISIVAPGGMGKTRLALELGSRMVNRFNNGVFFVELAPIYDSGNIIPAVAEAIGYSFQQNGRSQKQQVLDYLENRQLLIILDNFEHLINDGAQIVSEMLEAAPQLKVLITSRQHLNQTGEVLFTLHGLELPSLDSSADASQAAAVDLFRQAALRARPDFDMASETLQHIIRICRLVQGMPLGILLAAPWVTVLSTAEIAEEIQGGLDLLEAEGNELPQRLRSIRVVLDYAWSRMPEAEQLVFMKMAVFRGGFDRRAAQKVAGAGLRQLQSLVNKAIIGRDADQRRYTIHELLRQYAEERLRQSGLYNQTQDNHTQYYLTYLAEQTAALKGAGQLTALKQIEYDYENIHAGWLEAIDQREYTLIGQALEGMYLFCFLRSRLEDGKALFDKARSGLAPEAGHEHHPVWLALGIRFYRASDSRSILLKRLEISLAQARERDDPLEVAFCLHTLGTIAHYVNQNPAQAIEYYEECVAIYRQHGEKYYLSQTLSKLGEAYQLIGHTELTFKYVHEAYQLQREIGDQMGESETLRALGMTAFQTGDYVHMQEYIEKAYAIQLQTNYLIGQASSNLYLGSNEFWRGKIAQGRALVQRGLEQALDVVDFSTQAWCYAMLSTMDSAVGQYADAEKEFRQARAIEVDPFRQTGAGNPFLQLHIHLAGFLLEAKAGDIEAAKGHLYQPLHLAVMTSSHPYMTLFTAMAAMFYSYDGHPKSAAELLGLVFKQSTEITGWMKHWALLNQVQDKLSAELGQAVFEAALEQGKSLALKATSERVLKEIKVY
jgi:predicted ATPase